MSKNLRLTPYDAIGCTHKTGALIVATTGLLTLELRKQLAPYAKYKLTVPKVYALLALGAYENGLGVHDVASAAGVSGPSFSASLNSLEHYGLITSQRSVSGHRKGRITLTPEGKILTTALGNLVTSAFETVLEPITQVDRFTVRLALDPVVSALTR